MVIIRKAYPIILTKTKQGYIVFVPSFEINTQGNDIADAIYMARDAIGLIGIDMEDDGEELPEPMLLSEVVHKQDDVVTLVDVDFSTYRIQTDNRAVRKNLTIPNWLNLEAEKAGINFSKILQDALMEKLNVSK